MDGSSRVRGCVVAAALLVWVGCGGPESDQGGGDAQSVDSSAPGAPSLGKPEGTPVRGDWLVQRLNSDPENLNPITSSDANATDVLGFVFPRLLKLDPETLEQRPLVAAALPEVREDKLAYTFRLRDDVTFADGKPLTAADVLFTIKVIKHPEVRSPHLRNYYESVRDAVALDAHTVRFDLRQPYFRNDVMLGGIETLPRHYYDPENLLEGISVADLEALDKLDAPRKERARRFATQFNDGFQRRPMGAGAFEIKNPETDVVTGEKIVLTRRADYWAPGNPDMNDAWVNKVVFRVVNDSDAALTAFKGGSIDALDLTALQAQREDTKSEKFLSRARRVEHGTQNYSYIGWNQKRPMFQDVRVRRALGHFVDRQSMIQNILFGLGQTVESSVHKRRPEYKTDLPTYPFDPAKGKALLAEAGWKDSDGDGWLDKEIDGKRVPLRFELLTGSGSTTARAIGLAVIDELKRAGIDASFRELDWSILLERTKKFDYDAAIMGWRLPVSAPDLYQIFHSSQAVEGGSNHVAYKNAELDKLLEVYRLEFDADKRKALYDRVQQIIYDDQPYTFLFIPTATTVWDARFNGVNWYPAGNTDQNEWWVPTAKQKYLQ
jgi:peptide/nickel transport system substrate-binding protein